MIIFAIEASCDETAVAISRDGKLLSSITNSQIHQHMNYGGVVPELAARLHLYNFNIVARTALAQAQISWCDLNYIAYTAGPGLIGCLNISRIFAQVLGLLLKIPTIPINHLFAHLYANNINQARLIFPLLGLVVSGGHTHLYYLPQPLNFQLIGQSKDDAAGECLDKVGRMLGLNYPAGPEIEKLALTGRVRFQFPLPKTERPLDFSFSGLKTACVQKIHQLSKIKTNSDYLADFCASLQTTIIQILLTRLKHALVNRSVRMIAVGGGVTANQQLRRALTSLAKDYRVKIAIPPVQFSTDNAAMVAFLAEQKLKLQNL